MGRTTNVYTFYRGGGEGSMPRGISIRQVIEFEREELGNTDVTISRPDLDTDKATLYQWVCPDITGAEVYGEVEPVTFDSFVVYAYDDDGGLLVKEA